jgi:hypothetical protein
VDARGEWARTQVLNASATQWSLAGTWRDYFLTVDNLPFADSPLADEQPNSAVEAVRLVFRYRDVNFYSGQRVCIIWNVEVTYNILATSGILRPKFTVAQQNCNHPTCVPLAPLGHGCGGFVLARGRWAVSF